MIGFCLENKAMGNDGKMLVCLTMLEEAPYIKWDSQEGLLYVYVDDGIVPKFIQRKLKPGVETRWWLTFEGEQDDA
jgi:hypothetical protein